MENIINHPVTILKIPDCPNCQKAMKLLESIGMQYTLIDITKVDFDEIGNIIEFLERKTHTRTFPMIFANGRYVGDYREIENLHRVGVLEGVLSYRI
jgi:glutaredoxin